MGCSSTKLRKADENGAAAFSSHSESLTPADGRKIIKSFNQEQLISIIADAMCRDSGVLDAVRSVADGDPSQRKLFIRRLGCETTTEKLRSIFSKYGELKDAAVVLDKATGKSKGYGFVTFRHADCALLSLKEPSKRIDVRMTVAQLASDVSQRKIFIGNVSPDILPDRLFAFFSSFGEIAKGPMGLDKQTGNFRGYAVIVYKTAESAQAAVVEPVKHVDGNVLQCMLASDGKKGRTEAAGIDSHVEGEGMAS